MFDESRYIHKLIVGPNGEKLGYDTSVPPITVNNMAQAMKFYNHNLLLLKQRMVKLELLI